MIGKNFFFYNGWSNFNTAKRESDFTNRNFVFVNTDGDNLALWIQNHWLNSPKVYFAGVFAGNEDDIEVGSSVGGKIYFLKALGCFGVGTVTEHTSAYVASTGGYKRFKFTGQTAIAPEDLFNHTYDNRFDTTTGKLLPLDGVVYAIEGRGMSYAMPRTGDRAGCFPLFRLDKGDCLLNDGTFAFKDDAIENHIDDVVGIIVNPTKRIMLPVPMTAAVGAFAKSDNATLAVVNSIKNYLACITDCTDYDAAMYGLKSSLGNSDSRFDSYFPAFYAARFGSGMTNGYKRYLATKAECTLIGNDERIQDAVASIRSARTDSKLPTVFYGATPRYTVGDLPSVAYLALEGDESKGNATMGGSNSGSYVTLALYNE